MNVIAATQTLARVQKHLQGYYFTHAMSASKPLGPGMRSDIDYLTCCEQQCFDALAHGPAAANEPGTPVIPAA